MQELIGKLREAQAITGLTIETLLDTVLRHHVVYSDVLSNLSGEIEESHILCPVVIVHHLGAVGRIAVEVEKLGQLLLYGLLIMTECRLIKQVALGRLSGGITDHTGCATDESERLMSAALEMTQHHHSAEMADVERVGSRVDTEICGGHLFLELLLGAGHDSVDHSTPGKFFYKIHRYLFFNYLLYKDNEPATGLRP